jgi:uncharacterized protein (DUF433 family)
MKYRDRIEINPDILGGETYYQGHEDISGVYT